jgi:hypothetical protein
VEAFTQMKQLFRVTLVAVASLLASADLWEQSITTGEITGLVTDASDAVVPNVVVTLIKQTDGQQSILVGLSAESRALRNQFYLRRSQRTELE